MGTVFIDPEIQIELNDKISLDIKPGFITNVRGGNEIIDAPYFITLYAGTKIKLYETIIGKSDLIDFHITPRLGLGYLGDLFVINDEYSNFTIMPNLEAGLTFTRANNVVCIGMGLFKIFFVDEEGSFPGGVLFMPTLNFSLGRKI